MSKEAMQVQEAAPGYLMKAKEPDVPHGYKKTEVGVIPEDWEVRRLGDLYNIASSKRVLQSQWKQSGIPFYRTREIAILAERGWVENELFISEELYQAYIKKYGSPKAGDVLVTGIGTIGKAYVVPEKSRFYFKDASVIWLKSMGLFDSCFLEQLFKTNLILQQIYDSSTGTTVDTYTISGAKGTLVPVPKLKEQRAIAEALSDVDDLIGALDALIAKKRAIKQATMQQLLTGKTRLPRFSGEWEKKRAGDIGRFRGGTGFPVKHQGSESGDYPFFKVSDMNNEGNDVFMEISNNYISEEIRKKIGATIFPARSLVFAKVGAAVFLERKKILSKPSCLDNNMAAFMLNESVADFRYMHYAFLNINLGDLVSTTALPSLSGGVLSSIELTLPSIQEQVAIADVLSDMDTEIIALEQRRDKTRALKQGMMQQLLTGRIRLRVAK